MEPANLRSDPLYVKVYSLLKGWIIEGRMAPGERLGETNLAVELQVSRTPVRDALRRLEQDRLIVAIPGPAYEVYRPSMQDLADLYSTRALLEGGAARLAAQRQAPEIEEMARILDQMNQAYDEGSPQVLRDLDARLHELLVQASGNLVIQELHSHLSNRLRHLRAMSGDANTRRTQILSQHAEIVAALRGGDGAEAEEVTRAHILFVYDLARSAFAEKARVK